MLIKKMSRDTGRYSVDAHPRNLTVIALVISLNVVRNEFEENKREYDWTRKGIVVSLTATNVEFRELDPLSPIH